MRSDYRPNTKSGGVAIYHKDRLTVIRWNSIEEIIQWNLSKADMV